MQLLTSVYYQLCVFPILAFPCVVVEWEKRTGF